MIIYVFLDNDENIVTNYTLDNWSEVYGENDD